VEAVDLRQVQHRRHGIDAGSDGLPRGGGGQPVLLTDLVDGLQGEGLAAAQVTGQQLQRLHGRVALARHRGKLLPQLRLRLGVPARGPGLHLAALGVQVAAQLHHGGAELLVVGQQLRVVGVGDCSGGSISGVHVTGWGFDNGGGLDVSHRRLCRGISR
jgi:hypothetical protein